MKDPRHLVSGDADGEARQLLRAGLEEEVPTGAEARLLATLGLGTPLMRLESLAEDPVTHCPTPSATTAGAVHGAAALLAKPALLVLGAALLLGGGALWARNAQVAGTKAATQPERVHPRAREASATQAPLPQAKAVEPSPSIADEIQALDEVRRALRVRDGHAARDALDRFARAHPHAVLDQEATLLRVETLLLVGASDEARKIGERFLARHPKSPHARRVRRLLEAAHFLP